jgi:hypothetical protein
LSNRLTPLFLQLPHKILQRIRQRHRCAVGKSDLALHLDLDLAHGDVGIAALRPKNSLCSQWQRSIKGTPARSAVPSFSFDPVDDERRRRGGV